jgi:hypothetical protein
MFHNAARVLVVAMLVGIGWAAGHAQAPAQSRGPAQAAPPALSASSDFELLVSATKGDPKGSIEVRCVRGCRLTWAPTVVSKDGLVEILAPDLIVTGDMGSNGCVAAYWAAQNCHILGWKR